MRWYNHLYVGKSAKKKRFAIIQGIRHEKLQPGIFVITPAVNGKNLIDIYPSYMLLTPYYQSRDLLVIGIAYGYFEALEVVKDIVDQMFKTTGGFDLKGFLKLDKNEQP